MSLNINLIKRVIADQKEEIQLKKSKKFIKRDKLDFAKKYLDEPIVKVITGVRRCGKSTFCHQLLIDKNYAYLNFDDERLYGIKSADLDMILETLLVEFPNSNYILFDEIQNVDGWELFINRLLRLDYNIVLTGSNSKMLSKELATHLTGRHIQIELYPFSFLEFLDLQSFDFKKLNNMSTKNISDLRIQLQNYIDYGGFPEIINFDNRKIYLRDLFDKIILRDIVERYKIREIASLKELAVLMLNYFSSLITYNKLKNILNLSSVNTVKDFAIYLEETYLLLFLSSFSYKMKDEIKKPKKVYSIDTGMTKSLDTSLSRNIGRLYENIVFLHETRNGSNLNFYNEGNFEIDFLVKDNNKVIKLIQVSLDIDEKSKFDREINSLIKGAKLLNCDDLTLINENKDTIVEIDNYKIKIVPLWKYLINSDKL